MATQNMQSPTSNRFAWTLAAALLVATPGFASGSSDSPSAVSTGAEYGQEAGAPLADERASYSYLRTLEGSATAASSGDGSAQPLERNQPLLTGDLVRVEPGSRLEIALSDHNRLHLDAETGVVLERLAFSGDREERVTVLRLEGGELLLEVSDEALGDELPRIITANATVYIQQPGEYRVESGVENDGQSWTRIVTRRGFAEIVTDRGSSVVREDEAMLAVGDRGTRLELAAADAPDDLERWSAELAGRTLAGSRSAAYVEPHLADDAAPLDQAGDWVEYESVRYWRPYVSTGWRPYWQGRWDWTPSGYTWISYEPWGWVPYHYGRWCSLPGVGWAWRPGAVYSPAWVYWNWTSGWAGWVPMGYYSQFYDPWYGGGYRYGVYGWAGGGWGLYSNWNYAPVHCFRDRNFRGHMRTGRDLEHESRLPEPPKGLLTTDTRDFRPDRIDRTDDLLHEIGKRNRARSGQDLPDVTDFVGRKGKLPTDVVRVVVRDDRKEPMGTRDGSGDKAGGVGSVGGIGGKGGKGSAGGVIRDIGGLPKIAETPVWKQREMPRSDGRIHSPGSKGAPVQATDKGRTGGIATGGGTIVVKSPKETPASPIHVDKGSSPKTGSRETVTPAYGTKVSPGDASNRQQWKEKGGGSEPVQKVVGSVRRPAPGSEPASPSYAAPKPGTRFSPTLPAQPSQGYGKGPSGSTGLPTYGKGTSGSPGPQTYGKGTSGAPGPQTYGNGTSGAPGGPQTYGKGPSGSPAPRSYGKEGSSREGAQGPPTYGKSGGGSQGTPGYRKSAPGPQGSSGSPGYGRSSSGSAGSNGSNGSGKVSSPTPRAQAPQGQSKGGSGSQGSRGSQGAQPSGKGSSTSSGSKSHSSPPPPPPAEKKGDGGGRH